MIPGYFGYCVNIQRWMFQWTECTAVALNVLKRQVTSLFTNSLDLVYMVPTTTDVYVSRIFPKHSPLERSRIRGNIIGKRLGKVFLFNSTFPSFFFLRFLLTFPRKSCKLGMRS
uniref:Uncharacterized protein n=1 Tax=Cacopsylla melanoneura TaxID=428564 RepID=A0A8D8VG96_9HEMI